MTDTDPSADARAVTSFQVGPQACVIALRGTVGESAADDLRAELLAAIDGGVRGVVVDVSQVESLGPAAHDLIRAASATLTDRGGVLLTWSSKESPGRPTYVLAEIRDRVVESGERA